MRISKETLFWTIIVVVNIAVTATCGYYFNKKFRVVVYKRYTSQFMKDLVDVHVQKGGNKQNEDKNVKEEGAINYLSPHPYAGYKTEQNVKVGSDKLSIETNTLGHRSPQLGEKRPGTVRVAMVGGSAAFQGATNESTIIGQVSNILSAKGYDVEYINAGVISSNANQEMSIILHDLLDSQVDLVISYDGYNEINSLLYANGRIGWPAMRWDPVYDINTQTGKGTEQQAKSYYPYIVPRQHNTTREKVDEALRNYFSCVTKMAKICDAFGIKYLAIFQPVRNFDPAYCAGSDTDKFHHMPYFYCKSSEFFTQQDALKTAKGSFISLADALHDNKDVYVDDVHYTDAGNRLVAERVADIILKRHLLPAQ